MLEENMGVETQDVASPETVETQEPIETVDSYETPEQTEVETGEEQENPAAEDDSRFENAFAKRLAQERAKYQAEIELGNMLRSMGYDPQQTIEELRQRQLAEEAAERNVDPEFYHEFKQMQDELGFYKHQSTFARQDTELAGDPNHGEYYKQWRDDVHAEANKLGVDLNTAYTLLFRERFPQIMAAERRKSEQQAIQNIVQRDNSSVGPANGTPSMLKPDFSNMPSADFKEMLERAKRGELKNI